MTAQNEKRAFLVLGPESSGTRLFTRILIKAGCYGSYEHVQDIDQEIPDKNLIVWRRSVPHAQKFPNIEAMIKVLRKYNYSVAAFITNREWHSLMNSQILTRPHVKNQSRSFQNLQLAYPHIFTALTNQRIPFIVISFEAMIYSQENYINRMLSLFDLPPVDIEINNTNNKYYISK